jgi:uncharacterized protein
MDGGLLAAGVTEASAAFLVYTSNNLENPSTNPKFGVSVPHATFSTELFSIPLEDGLSIVYAPLRRAAFLANTALVNAISTLRETGEIQPDLDPDDSILEFLRTLEIVDAGPEHQPTTKFEGTPQPTLVTLFLTTACNLRCTYCYASAGDRPAKFMSFDVAKRGIDFVSGNAKRKGLSHFEVIFHGGGEPTVHWTVMTAALDYARRRASEFGLGVKAYSATNGMLTDGQVDWIVANLNGLSLSFDGLPRAHDKNRLTVLGTGSSERVMSTIRRLDRASFPYGLRVTVTAEQIADLPASIEFICAEFQPRRIMVEPAYQLGRWADRPSSETESFVAMFREASFRAEAYGQRLFYSAARVGTLTSHFCGVTQDAFALSPDGNVSACYETFSEDNPLASRFFYGAPDTSENLYKFELPILNNLRQQAVNHRPYCQGCFAKWSCGGDCYHKALTVNPEDSFSGTDRCYITRELTKDQILAKIAASGGLFWHEGAIPINEEEAIYEV